MDAKFGSAVGALLRSCSSSVTFGHSPPVGQIGLSLGLWAAPPGIIAGYPGGSGQIHGRGDAHPSVEPRESLEDDRFRALPAFVAHRACPQFPARICPAFVTLGRSEGQVFPPNQVAVRAQCRIASRNRCDGAGEL